MRSTFFLTCFGQLLVLWQGDVGLPGLMGLPGDKGEKGSTGKRGRRVSATVFRFLPERDYVTFGPLLSQIRLSCVTFVRPTQGLKFTAIFLRHCVP